MGARIQDLAVACLGNYADASLVNCGKIAAVGGGPALGAVAAAAAADGGGNGGRKDRLRASPVAISPHLTYYLIRR
jgi:hypothetical protein